MTREKPEKPLRARGYGRIAAVLGVVVLAVGAARAQERARRGEGDRRPPAAAAAAALPDLSRSAQLELSLPEEGAPSVLKVRSQDADGQFSGLLLRPAGTPAETPVRGRVSRAESGGVRLFFTYDVAPDVFKSFEGAIFVTPPEGAEPGRIFVAGTYTVLEQRQVTAGPFPFSGSGRLAGAPDPVAPAVPPSPPASTPSAPAAPGDSARLRSTERVTAVPRRGAGGAGEATLREALRSRDLARVQADLYGTLERQGNLKTFLRLARAAGQEEYFRKGKITLFVPDDAAFARLPAGTVEELLRPENRERLLRYVNYCIAYGGKYLTLPEGKPGALPLPADRIETRTAGVSVSWEGSRLFIRGNDSRRAEVIGRDIDGGNGALFITNVVLFPKSTRID
jgi:uncharacterized surface protein with fasciclin (FAS1) repeats